MRTLIPTLCLTLLVTALPARAQEQIQESETGVRFQKTPTVGGQTYQCLGAGVRKKVFFKVYSLGYCVEQQQGLSALDRFFEGPGKGMAEQQGEELEKSLKKSDEFYQYLIAMPVPKMAQLLFTRNVDQGKVKDAFREGLTKAMGEGEKQRIENFIGLLDRDLKKGDTITLRTDPKGDIYLRLSNDKAKNLTDEKIAVAVWEAYLGKDSVSPSLKDSVAKGVSQLRSQRAPAIGGSGK